MYIFWKVWPEAVSWLVLEVSWPDWCQGWVAFFFTHPLLCWYGLYDVIYFRIFWWWTVWCHIFSERYDQHIFHGRCKRCLVKLIPSRLVGGEVYWAQTFQAFEYICILSFRILGRISPVVLSVQRVTDGPGDVFPYKEVFHLSARHHQTTLGAFGTRDARETHLHSTMPDNL